MAESDVTTKVNLAVSAAESGDYASAILYMDSAIALRALTPVDASHGQERVQFDHQAMVALRDRWARSQATALGVQRTKHERVVVS